MHAEAGCMVSVCVHACMHRSMCCVSVGGWRGACIIINMCCVWVVLCVCVCVRACVCLCMFCLFR